MATGQRLESAFEAETEAARELTSQLSAPRRLKIEALEVVETNKPESES